jgi:hypothetical protein
MAMAGDMDDDSLKITDIYVMHEQVVSVGECNETPKGKLKTHLELQKNNQARFGWAHTHPGSNTQLSPTDHILIKKDTPLKGIPIEIDLYEGALGDEKLNIEVLVYHQLVFHGNMTSEEEPYKGVSYFYKPLVVEGGSSKLIRKESYDSSVSVRVVDGDAEIDHDFITDQILDRVSLTDRGYLRDIIHEINQPEIEQEFSIDDRVLTLENNHDKMQDDIANFMKEYQARFRSFEEKILTLSKDFQNISDENELLHQKVASYEIALSKAGIYLDIQDGPDNARY